MSELAAAIEALNEARAHTTAAPDPRDPRTAAVLDLALAVDSAGGAVALSAGVSAALDRLDVAWDGRSEVAVRAVTGFLRAVGGLPSEVAALEALPPGAWRAGLWAQVDRRGMNAGWTLEGSRPLASALELVDSPATGRVAAWAADHGVDRCERLRRAAAGNAFTAVDLPLPPATGGGLGPALELIDGLGMPRPSADVLGALSALHDGPVLVTVALSSDGASRTGLVARNPSAALASDLMGPGAAFGVRLGAPDPSDLRVERRLAAEEAVLCWRLA